MKLLAAWIDRRHEYDKAGAVINKLLQLDSSSAPLGIKDYFLLHRETDLRIPLSPLTKASFFVRDQRLICASRFKAELLSG